MRVPGLNFAVRQYSQWEILANGHKGPVIPAAFYELTIPQIEYFTKVAEQIRAGNLAFPRKLDDKLKSI